MYKLKNLVLLFITFSMSCSNKSNFVQRQNSSCLRYFDQSLKMEVYTAPSEPAEYPGGMAAAISLVHTNTIYPEQDELQLKASICFVVDIMGELNSIAIYKKEIADYSNLDFKLIRAFKKMKKWKPAKCNGRKVPSLVIIPLHIDVS